MVTSTKDHRINNIPPDSLNPFPSNFINRELTREGMKTADMAAFGNNKKGSCEKGLYACARSLFFSHKFVFSGTQMLLLCK